MAGSFIRLQHEIVLMKQRSGVHISAWSNYYHYFSHSPSISFHLRSPTVVQRDVQKREHGKGSVKTHFISGKTTDTFCAIAICVCAWEGHSGTCANARVYPPNLISLCDLKSMHHLSQMEGLCDLNTGI